MTQTTKPQDISLTRRLYIGFTLILGLRIRDYRSAIRFMNHRFAGKPIIVKIYLLSIWGLKMSFVDIPNASPWFSIHKDISNVPHWLKDGNPFENYPWDQEKASLPKSVDVVVVGAGFGGACVAYHWSKIGTGKLLLLDRASPASGAAGRNAGFLTAAGGSYHGYYVFEPVRAFAKEVRPTLNDLELDAIATGFCDAYLRALTESVEGIHATIKSESIDCDLQKKGAVILSDKEDAPRLQRALDLGTALGWDGWDRIEANEVENQTGIKGQNFAGLQKGTSTWNPARWVWGLIRIAIKSENVELFSETNVIDIVPNEDGFIVKTNRGNIFASKVVNATEANTSKIFGKFFPANKFDLIRTHKCQAMYGTSVIDGMPKEKAICLPLGWFHGRESGFLFGSDNHRVPITFENANDPSRFVTMYMSAETIRTWPNRNFQVTREWTGCVGQTPDKFPLIGALVDPNVFMLGGFAGAGSAISFGAALEIVESIIGMSRKKSLWAREIFGLDRFLATETYGNQFL